MSIITHVKADLFAAPAQTILVHACNTRGSWGGGIATVFKDRYPDAYTVYNAVCKAKPAPELLGTCLLIRGETHDIACLFTSKDYGRRVDAPESILRATRAAVAHLLEQNRDPVKPLHAWCALSQRPCYPHIFMNNSRFNSDKFAVPWEETEKVLNELGAEMTVYERP